VADSSIKNMPALHVADLATVKPADLEELWQHEAQVWRQRLCWDISDTIDRLRRAVEHGVLSGKVLRAGTRTLGCMLYLSIGHLGVISNFVIAPECSADAAEILLRETVRALRRLGISRIESSFIPIDIPWLCPLFEREGFHTYWRDFLRYELRPTREPISPPPHVRLEAWRQSYLREAASIMLAAYEGSIDAEMSEQCRTQGGCELELDDILNQGICGSPITEASAMAQQRGRGIGFIIVTEIGPRQAHVAEVAVLPAYQHQGIGRLLLGHSLSKLADYGFTTVSLFVSRLNHRALGMYKTIGFKPVLSFPVFAWQD
jgi:ribosomal protein S18 acetylase RimI-like enzyme